MRKVGKYTILETVGVSGDFLFYRAKQEDFSGDFLIKTIGNLECLLEGSTHFQHEFKLFQHLNKLSSHFPKVVDYLEDDGICGIVIKDEGFKPLPEVYRSFKIPVDTFFPLAIEIVNIISVLHEESIIHRNLTRGNILIHPESHVIQIADLSIATELERLFISPEPPEQLLGTLKYMSPEQTGRMNRALTSRSDLYSLGVIFYEMLIGSLPFTSIRPIEMITDYIGKIPKPPSECDDEIPEVLSQIIMKLLEKFPENRYKSAYGLAFDLKKAWQLFKEEREIPTFTLATNDRNDHWELPDKVYGRETERNILFSAFDELNRTEQIQLVVVSGHSGIGKTRLVHEIEPKVALRGGLFVSGKFNPFPHRDVYEGIRTAFDRIVQYFMNSSEADYLKFRDHLISELGHLLGVLIEFIPQLERIVGKQPKLPRVGIEQMRNRFELAIHQFLKVLGSITTLVIFLDDLQWANKSMFYLLNRLVTTDDVKNIMIIISYRSNQIDEQHPLIPFIENVKKKRKPFDIIVKGLESKDLMQILKDVLYLPEKEVSSLAIFLEKKTEGNPLFLLMLLEELKRGNLLKFSIKENRWRWEQSKMEELYQMANLEYFIKRRLEKLPKTSKNLLHLAACIGNSFTLNEIVKTFYLPLNEILNGLTPAMKDNLICHFHYRDKQIEGTTEKELLNREYRFLHDKMKSNSIELKSFDETEVTHLMIARNWSKAYGKNPNYFIKLGIIDQYDKGLSRVEDEQEKLLICKLNHEAGDIAMQQAAYEVAFYYDDLAKRLLPKEMWSEDYDYAFNVCINYIKSSFMAGRYYESDTAAENLLERANNNYDRAVILNAKGNLRRATGKIAGNIPLFTEGLKLLGYENLGKNPNLFQVIYAILRYKLFIRFFGKNFDNLPKEADTVEELICMMNERVAEESYFKGNSLRFIYTVLTWCLETYHKHSLSHRATCYGSYCIFWPRSEFSLHLGESVMQLQGEIDNNAINAATFFALNTIFLSWHHPWSQVIENYNKSLNDLTEVGNLEFLGLCHFNIVAFNEKLTCDIAKQEFLNMKNFVAGISPRSYILANIFLQFYKNLCGDVPPNSWKTEDFDDKEAITSLEKMNYVVGVNRLYINKIRLAFHFNLDDVVTTEKNALRANLNELKRTNQPRDNLTAHFFLFLLETKQYNKLSFIQRFKSRLFMRKLYNEVKSWVKFCPANFEHCRCFMEAEYARIEGKFEKSLELYDETASIASKNEVPEYQALAYQQALILCLEMGKEEVAKIYAEKAIRSYTDWKAYGVVKTINEKIQSLL